MMASTSKLFEADEMQVAGVSRSGRVRKKSSKLMYLDTTDAKINNKKKNKLSKSYQTPKQFKNTKNDNIQNQSDNSNENFSYESQKRKLNNQKKFSAKYPPNQKKVKTESSSEVSVQTNSETESDTALSNNELQTPDYTSYDEDSLASDEDLLTSKLNMPLPEPKKIFSSNELVETKVPTDSRNPVYTGYKLWSSEMKKEILKKYPSIDMTIMTIRLGEMWTKMSINDRNNWHHRAQCLTEKVECIQKKSVTDYDKPEWLNSCINTGGEDCQVRSFDEIKLRTIMLQPIDVAAHLKLLGESLMLIGARLKRHDKPIAVSDCITVLLDSLLCAMGSLICLTQQIPIIKLDNCVTFIITLENITYIMPGL